MAPAPRRDIMPTQPRSYGQPRAREPVGVGRKNVLAREGMQAQAHGGGGRARSPVKAQRGESGTPQRGARAGSSGDPLISRRGNCVPGWTDASRGGKFQRMNPSGSQLQLLCEDGWEGPAGAAAYPSSHLLLSTAALPPAVVSGTHTLCLHVRMMYQSSRAMLFGVVAAYAVEPPAPTASVDAQPLARFILVALQQQQGGKLCAQVLRCSYSTTDGCMTVDEPLTQSTPVVGRSASSIAINPRDTLTLNITKTFGNRLSFSVNGVSMFKNINAALPAQAPDSPSSAGSPAPPAHRFGLCGVGVKATIRDIQIKEGTGDATASASSAPAAPAAKSPPVTYHDTSRRGVASREGRGQGVDQARPPAGVSTGGKKDRHTRDDDRFASVIEQEILSTNPNVQWEDIAALGEAKRLLNEAVVLPMIIPEFFTGIRTPWQGVLLFGPPGTGKTLLAKAVATCANTTFFNMTASTLLSKYHGESEKMIKTLFHSAREHAPSTIFFDEIDALMMKRGDSHEHEASRRLKSELLSEMSGINTNNQEKRVMILATSNKPWDLDEAFRRRLEKRIYIPLPEAEARVELFSINLKDLQLAPDVSVEGLAAMTDGYSGADIHQVCRDASMGPMRRLIANRTPMEIAQMKQDGLLSGAVELAMRDFEESIAKIHPSVNLHEIARYKQWEKDFAST
eukprot:TRINITY_DN5799_c0_g6_i1.p1 TRINITY_DN5799_c0_g6~~TRINITY_DN5799_c0_g6_i1.p1  ORF type:complete len:710 (+),score=225.53 TRINITY_DN5799_c0_g6_i1:88-2130(+)